MTEHSALLVADVPPGGIFLYQYPQGGEDILVLGSPKPDTMYVYVHVFGDTNGERFLLALTRSIVRVFGSRDEARKHADQ